MKQTCEYTYVSCLGTVGYRREAPTTAQVQPIKHRRVGIYMFTALLATVSYCHTTIIYRMEAPTTAQEQPIKRRRVSVQSFQYRYCLS